MEVSMSKLALLGGTPAVTRDRKDAFKWPIITKEDEEAVLEVLRRGGMSGTDITKKFEAATAGWLDMKYALGFHNGTAAVQAAMYGCKVGVGDEIICPSVTYWASVVQAFSLGATPVFAEVDPDTLCLDPKDIERHITKKTKAIVLVHYVGHPCDMDPIMKLAKKYKLKVIEDISHAQGGLYKGRKVGTIGHVGAMSLMSGKSFVAGEAGMFVTNDLEIYERAIAFGHYERFDGKIKTAYLKPFAGLPLGGYKYRMHQLSAAVGLVQLKYHDIRMKEIQKAMNYFWDLLEGTPGLKAHRPDKNSGSTMGGWYFAHGLYKPEELGGLSVTRFAEAVRAEGATACGPGCNKPLHLHALFNTCDVYGHGKPTRLAHTKRDLRQLKGSLPVSESINARTYGVPWFKKFYPEIIEEHANAFKKVSANYKELLKGDKGNSRDLGGWHFFSHR